VATPSDSSLGTVNTNEILSVRLVQSPGSGPGGLINGTSNGLLSPLLGGMGIRGAVPTVNVRPPSGDGEYGISQDTIGTFSEGSSRLNYQGNRWDDRAPVYRRDGAYSGLGSTKNDMTTSRSVDSFTSRRTDEANYRDRGTWYQTRDSSHDAVHDAIAYPVSRVSGPLSPMSASYDWNRRRARIIEYGNGDVNGNNSGKGSGEILFV
jgi:hypothetical protein